MPNGENDGYTVTAPLSRFARCSARRFALTWFGYWLNKLFAPTDSIHAFVNW
jgi:hypothetical protein